MKINDKIISLPPYISTTWDNISSLHMKGTLLVFTLKDGETVSVPGLKQEVIDSIFEAHSSFHEKETMLLPPENKIFNAFPSGPSDLPFRLGFGTMDSMGTSMQHNPAQSDMPPLPPEVINKIAQIAKIIAPEEIINMPKAVDGCNCVHCQITRAINAEAPVHAEEDAIVTDNELEFCQWDIDQVGDKLYDVTNRLDNNEKYHVFLGDPVGCTCGKQGCEHILAVLKS